MKSFKIITFLALILPALAGAQLIKNGSFEEGKAGQVPPGWHFGNNRDAEVRMVIDDTVGSAGSSSLKITNKTPYKPHVYGTLSQSVKLEVGKSYRLIFDIKGQDASRIGFIVGNTWRVRWRPRTITSEWQTHEFTFKIEEKDLGNQGNVPIRLTSEDLAEAAWIDNIRIIPAGSEVISPVEAQVNRVMQVRKINGELSAKTIFPQSWNIFTVPADAKHHSSGKTVKPQDLEMKFGIGDNEAGLVFIAEVKDDKVMPGRGESLWGKDSIQLRISPEGSRVAGELDSDLELGFSVDGNKVNTWCWQLGRELNTDEALVYGQNTPDGYRLVAQINWKLLGKKLDLAGYMSFNVIVNDADRMDVPRQVAFLGRGIHDNKSNFQNTLLLPAEAPMAVFVNDNRNDPQILVGTLYATGLTKAETWNLELNFTDSKGETSKLDFEMPPLKATDIMRRKTMIPLNKIAYGKYQCRISAGDSELGQFQAVRADQLKDQLAELKEFSGQFAVIEKALAAQKQPSRYFINQFATLKRQVSMQQRYLTLKQPEEVRDFYLNIGKRVNQEIAEALKTLESELSSGKSWPETYQYVSSPISGYQYGLPVVETQNEAGQASKRPQFFSGYGHFSSAQNDIPHFPEIGANVIQFETGPSRIFPKPGADGDFSAPSEDGYQRTVEMPLKKAWENNVKVCLLLSPHYVPHWWLAKYPEAKSNGKGFLKYEVNHPKSRDMVKAYLDYLIPKLYASPYRDALLSIQLTNEPTYRNAVWDDPGTMQRFEEWLNEKHGGIPGFNQISGQQFAGFGELQAAGLQNPAVRYEFQQFRRVTFLEWHKFMDTIVRQHFPGIKISSKIMMSSLISPEGVNDAVEPEMFAEISDYNGNDNYMNYGEGRWISNWIPMSFGHDLQYAMRPLPIVNSENHIIKDGETRLIPPGHVYTAIFQQFTQGVGALMTWVWHENTYERFQKDEALRGNIYHRPGNIIAHGAASLDANRLVGELSHFVEAEPVFALLYSPTSHIQNSENYWHTLVQLYTTLAFTGHKVTFISEKQLAAEKFGKLKAIIATDTNYLPDSAVQGLQKFTTGGGKIYNYSESFKFNEYGQPRHHDLKFTQVKGELSSANALKQWRERLDSIHTLPITLSSDNPNDTLGIFFRAVETPDGCLINIVNYNQEPRRIKLQSKGKIFDLIGQQDFPGELELNPLQPLFLKNSPKN